MRTGFFPDVFVFIIVGVSCLLASCKRTEGAPGSSKVLEDSPSSVSYFSPVDQDDLELIGSALKHFSQPKSRYVELDYSGRIESKAAEELFEKLHKKYTAKYHCTDLAFPKKRSFDSIERDIRDGYLNRAKSVLDTMTLSDEDLEPFLEEVTVWTRGLYRARESSTFFPSRICIFVTSKAEGQPQNAGQWHIDAAGEVTAIWTIHGEPTWYTEGTKVPSTDEVLTPERGRVLFMKGSYHPDVVERKIKAVLHTTPPVVGDRLTLVSFFNVGKAE